MVVAPNCIGRRTTYLMHSIGTDYLRRFGGGTTVCFYMLVYGLRSGNYEIIDFDLDTGPIQYQYLFAVGWKECVNVW